MQRVRSFSPALFAVLAVLALLVGPLAPAPADAAVVKPLDVVKVHFDPAGRDAMNNAGFNKEYFVVKNTGKTTLDLSSYYVLDNGGKHRFTFPRGTKLKAGKSITVRSGRGKNTASTLYYQNKTYVWNNEGDKLTLFNAKNKKLETCNFLKRPSGTTKTC